MSEETNPKPKPTPDNVVNIPKPKSNFLERFKSKHAPNISGVGTLLNALPIYKLGAVDDYLRLHHDEENYWTHELCFVSVPILGVNRPVLHVIDDDIAVQFLPSKKIQRMRLALGAKPFDVFFFGIVPSQNVDNAWNASVLSGCQAARTQWTQITSRSAEGVEGYKVDPAHDPDAFPDPNWPGLSLDELLDATFGGDKMIDHKNHPALKRLTGRKQDLT